MASLGESERVTSFSVDLRLIKKAQILLPIIPATGPQQQSYKLSIGSGPFPAALKLFVLSMGIEKQTASAIVKLERPSHWTARPQTFGRYLRARGD